MWQTMRGALAACLLVTAAAGVAVAQDEELRMGDDPAYFERVEVPEAGIAVSFPPDWETEVTMELRETTPSDPEAAPVSYWRVLEAGREIGAWCHLAKWDITVEDLAGMAAGYADDYLGGRDAAATADVSAVELTVGDAFRVDTYDPGRDDGTTFFFASATAMYYLECLDDVFDEYDWMDIAQTVEWLPAEPKGGTESVDAPDPDPTTSEPSPDDRRLEVPEFGVALTVPALWTYELALETGEYQLPADFGDSQPVPQTHVLSMTPPDSGLCILSAYEDMPMGPERHALEHGAAGMSSFIDAEPVVTRVQLPVGEAYRVDFESMLGGLARAYAFDIGPTRYLWDCWIESGDGTEMRAIASSIGPIGSDQPTSGLVPVELADAGIALAFPADWEVLPQYEQLGLAALPDHADVPSMGISRMMQAFPVEGAWCNVYMYDGIPLPLEDHGDWFAEVARTSAPSKAAEVERFSLPVGETVRMIETAPDGSPNSIYLFDLDGVREYLVCGGQAPADDDWLSIAETIGSLTAEPTSTPESPAPDADTERVEMQEPGFTIPDDAVSWDDVEDFGSVVPVAESPTAGSLEGSLMSADCQRAMWLELADGSFEERLECTLTEVPVDPPEWQGAWPGEKVSLSGGSCEWTSDYWTVTDGSDVWASSYEISVDPDGRVVGSSTYAAEMLDCSEE